jgi:hypothetical protein
VGEGNQTARNQAGIVGRRSGCNGMPLDDNRRQSANDGMKMPEIDSDRTYSVYWPGSLRQGTMNALAPRLNTLAGKKIALLWGYLFRGDEVYSVIETALKSRFRGISFINWSEFGSIHGNSEQAVVAALPGKLRQLGADAVLSGMGC